MIKKRIVFLLPNLAGGGAEQVALTIIKYLKENTSDLEIELVLQEKEGPLLDNNYDYILANRNTLGSILSFYSYAKNKKIDLVVSFMVSSNIVALIVNLLLRKKQRYRTILTTHNNISYEREKANKTFKGKIVSLLIKSLYKNTDKHISVSKGCSREIENYLDNTCSVDTIYNPIPVKEIKSRIHKKPDHRFFDVDTPLIISVGRLHSLKNFPLLFNVIKKVLKKHRVNLLILGEGDERKKLEKIIHNYGIQDNVDLFGFVPCPSDYIAHASLFVLTSKFEGFGNVIVESMACGTPVVSVNAPFGPIEIIGKNSEYGLLVDSYSADRIADAIEKLLESKKLSIFYRQQGLLRADNFDVNKICHQYEQMIRELIDKV